MDRGASLASGRVAGSGPYPSWTIPARPSSHGASARSKRSCSAHSGANPQTGTSAPFPLRGIIRGRGSLLSGRMASQRVAESGNPLRPDGHSESKQCLARRPLRLKLENEISPRRRSAARRCRINRGTISRPPRRSSAATGIRPLRDSPIGTRTGRSPAAS